MKRDEKKQATERNSKVRRDEMKWKEEDEMRQVEVKEEKKLSEENEKKRDKTKMRRETWWEEMRKKWKGRANERKDYITRKEISGEKTRGKRPEMRGDEQRKEENERESIRDDKPSVKRMKRLK